jgi:hypothetical protein
MEGGTGWRYVAEEMRTAGVEPHLARLLRFDLPRPPLVTLAARSSRLSGHDAVAARPRSPLALDSGGGTMSLEDAAGTRMKQSRSL